MTRRILNCEIVAEVSGFGICRVEERKLDPWTQEEKGYKEVWYEVCEDGGKGDILDAFKTLRAAKAFARKQ